MPWLALVSGLILYLGDAKIQGIVPHINAAIHESGHLLACLLTGSPAVSVNIGSEGDLIFAPFRIGITNVNIHWTTLQSYVDPGLTSPGWLFFIGGPTMSLLWGALLVWYARKMGAKPGRMYLALTIVLTLGGLDSFVGRGLFNLLPIYPGSDGAKLLGAIF